MRGKHIIAVDQSTSATKAFLLDERGIIRRRVALPHRQYYPAPGCVEHDAEEIWRNVCAGIAGVSEGVDGIAGLAISNQRETTVLWDRADGRPLHPAIVWQDVRGEALCAALAAHTQDVRRKTGLLLSPYFSAAKAAHALQMNPALREKAAAGDLCIGTVDSYLVYRLTGGSVFRTDVSNASRTQLMRLDTLAWDEALSGLFEIPLHCLGEIVPSDASFGQTAAPGIPEGIPITGVMGDSHAALFGQGCHTKGMTKATYGTGSSVMMNTGGRPVLSAQGLSTSVGFAFGGKTCYVLEGNVTCSGDTLCWLRDEMGLLASIDEAETLARSVESSMGVYLVPAFSGLGAPHHRETARALLCGMSRSVSRAHIARAALESMALQDADIILAMQAENGGKISELRADGGPARNGFLMQFQADVLDCPVQCASVGELSALGAGWMAGLAVGLYPDFDSVSGRAGIRYTPERDALWRREMLDGWAAAVRLCG